MDHSHSHSHPGDRQQNLVRLAWACGLTFIFMLIEAVAGYLTNSLALIADAGHMLADVASLLLALVAAWFATKPATTGKTYGYYRSEILSGLITSFMLIGMAIFLFVESYHRFLEPMTVKTGPMLVVAVLGLGVNLIGIKILHGGASHSINVKAAYLEVLADLLSSVGVVIAGLVMMFTGWYLIDPIVCVLIALWILPRTWHLLSECINVLMEGTPGHIDIAELRTAILKVSGVVGVHDIHVWTISTGLDAMSSHVELAADCSADDVLGQVTLVVQEDFGIRHSTIQVEQEQCQQNDNGTCAS
jgi:cobalt-zinc-cadmium efflux system protein